MYDNKQEEHTDVLVFNAEGNTEIIKVNNSSMYGANGEIIDRNTIDPQQGIIYSGKDVEVTREFAESMEGIVLIVGAYLTESDEQRAKEFIDRKTKKPNIFNDKKQPIGFGKQQRGGYGKASMRRSSRGR